MKDVVKMGNGWAQGWVLYLVFALIKVMAQTPLFIVGPLSHLTSLEQNCPLSPSWNIIPSWLPGHHILAHWSFPSPVGSPHIGGPRHSGLGLFFILILPQEICSNAQALSSISMLIHPILPITELHKHLLKSSTWMCDRPPNLTAHAGSLILPTPKWVSSLIFPFQKMAPLLSHSSQKPSASQSVSEPCILYSSV